MKIPIFYFVILLVTVFVFAACSHKTIPAASVPSAASNGTADTINLQQQILLNINQHRQAIGLAPLQMLDAACRQATRHSSNMAAKLTPFGHTGFDARVIAISKSLGTVSAAAENVAEGKLTAQQVVAGWLHSPGHKKNIEGNYS